MIKITQNEKSDIRITEHSEGLRAGFMIGFLSGCLAMFCLIALITTLV